MFKTIIVGVDGREGGRDALALAGLAAARLRQRPRRRARLSPRLLPRPRAPTASTSRPSTTVRSRPSMEEVELAGVRRARGHGRRRLAGPRAAPRGHRPRRRPHRGRLGAPRARGPRPGRRRDRWDAARRTVPRPRRAARTRSITAASCGPSASASTARPNRGPLWSWRTRSPRPSARACASSTSSCRPMPADPSLPTAPIGPSTRTSAARRPRSAWPPCSPSSATSPPATCRSATPPASWRTRPTTSTCWSRARAAMARSAG